MIPGLDQGLRPEGSPSSSSPDGDQSPDQNQYPDQPLPPYGDQYADQQGNSDMNHREEEMERLGLDDDSGWGFSSITSALKRGARGLEHGVEKGAGAVYKYSGTKYLLNKAEAIALYPIHRVVNAFKGKMVGRKSQELAKQRGLAAPGPAEKAEALAWAKAYVRKAHPTYGKLVSSMMGGSATRGHPPDEMGLAPVVLYPLIVLGAATLALVLEKIYQSAFSHGAASAQQVDPNADPSAPGYPGDVSQLPPDSPYDPSMPPDASMPPGTPPQYADPNADPYASQGEDMSTGITGEDSLGAFATEILSGVASP